MKVEHASLYNLAQYGEHLRGLTREDKASRFGHVITDYNIDQMILGMLKNHQDHKLWMMIIDDKPVGWGHMARDRGDSWELAVSVDHDYQRRGVGNELISTMLKWAKIHGIQKVYMHCIEDNKVIQHLSVKNQLTTRSRGDGERTAAIELAEPTIFELTDQRLQEQSEIFKQIGDLRTKLTVLWASPFLPK